MMTIRVIGFLLAVLLVAPIQAQAPAPSWPQWGGPSRNFMVSAPGLAASWPDGGPRRLWSRALGEGHSAIAVDGGRLFTMYRPAGLLSLVRRTQEEAIGAFDEASGRPIWEHRYPAPTGSLDLSAGAGPHSTPLVIGNRVFATSTMQQLFALDKQTGTVAWSHDLIAKFGGHVPGRGYTCSPLAYRDLVLVTVGGRGQAVVAFRQKDGAVAWKGGDFDAAPASPLLINVDGQDQIVVFGADRVAGLDAANGTTLWSHPHSTSYGLNISTPVWGGGNQLFISSAYNGGTRLLQLTRNGPATSVRELWFTSRMRVHFGTVIRLGDYIYGSSGDFGPAFLVAVDSKTGRVAWQDRSFARANLVYADGKAILLDEDGTLGLVTLSPTGLNVLARASVLQGTSWTVPTLVGSRLYVRDRKNMVALDLAARRE
jgi:outer membrane protein assembly factor BamB